MDNILVEKTSALKEAIENSPEVKELKNIEKELNNDEIVMKLVYRKDMAALDFEDAVKHFGNNSNEAKVAQKKLYEAKLNLDNNELVKKYNKQYKKVREMYDRINEELFNPFN